VMADPAVMESAIEEFLRVFAAAPFIGRRVVQDVELSGVHIPAGGYVWYNLGGANRDPEVFDDPQRLDIMRSPNKHLTFATGVHRCLGAHFARQNIRVALEAFLSRVGDFEVRDGFEPHFEGGMTRRLLSLEVTFSA
jgi:cytochrome P450